MTPEKLKTNMELLNASVASAHTFWKMYSTVALALLGYVFAADRPIHSLSIRIILTAVFAVFAYSNWFAFVREHRKLIMVFGFVMSSLDAPEDKRIADALRETRPSNICGVTLFHVFLDVSVMAIVLLAPLIVGSLK